MKLLSWDGNNINDGTNYDAVLNANFYGLPGIRAILGKRHGSWPILAGVERPYHQINFDIYIRSGSSLELNQWFDPEDETAKQLIVEDDDGSNDRFVNAICTELREVPYSAGLQYAVTVMIDGDVRWRETSPTAGAAWNITASGDTKTWNNNGQDKAFPILTIKPTGARSSGGFAYKRFVAIKWNYSGSMTDYPIDIVNNTFDTAALTTAKMQADGDDLRVYVNGLEVDRWLQDMDAATTQVWCNFDFSGNIVLTLNGAHNNSVTTVYVNEAITNMPDSGIIYIGTEVITYTSKNNQERKFTGCTRGAKGTTAAAHSDDDDVYWIQHDVWIFYGDSSAANPPDDVDNKPMFRLDSTNISWDYDEFHSEDYPNRSAQWQKGNYGVLTGPEELYGGDRGASADPWVEMGIYLLSEVSAGIYYIKNPLGITNANFQNGEYNVDNATWPVGYIYSFNGASWIYEDIITFAVAGAWTAWSNNEALDSGSSGVRLWFYNPVWRSANYLEVSDVTLTLDSTYTPTIVLGSEQSNYTLSARITNQTTGDAVDIDFDMALNEELELDTDSKTLIYLDQNTNQFNALDLVGGARKLWLPMAVGGNNFKFEDVGTGNVTIEASWYLRYYE